MSISTVSRALSNSRGISQELRSQIQGLARELGYEARGAGLSEQRLVRIYVTVNLMTGGLVAFYSGLIEALKEYAAAAGFGLEVRMVRQGLEPQRLERDDNDAPASATFLVGLDLTPEIIAFYGPKRPMVLVNTVDPQMRYDCVTPNNFYGALTATNRLLAAGHRHLLHIREQLRWTTLQRHVAFFDAVSAMPGAVGETADTSPDSDAALATLARAKASGKAQWTGVFAVHDSAAIRFIHALEEAGLRVPRDVSVIGFDDLPAAAMMTPRLSTMVVDTRAMAQQAVVLMQRRLAEPGAARLTGECGVTPIAGETIAEISAI